MQRRTLAFLVTPLVPPIIFTLVLMIGESESLSIQNALGALIFSMVLGAPIGYLLMLSILLSLWPVIARMGRTTRFVLLSATGFILGLGIGLAITYLVNPAYIFEEFVFSLATAGLIAGIVFWWLTISDQSLKSGTR